MPTDPREALRALVAKWRAMRHAPDDVFEWCDYDMEIEASKRAFEQCADEAAALLAPEKDEP